MSSLINAIIKWAVALLPFVLLCLMSKRVNLKKPYRSKQFPMPAVALVFSIAAMTLINRLNMLITDIINFLPNLVERLAKLLDEVSWMPEEISEFLVNLSEILRQVISSLNLTFWVFFISNCVIVVAYLIVKKIVISVLSNAVNTHSVLHEKIAGVFYDYFPEKDTWCVKNSYAQARTYLKWFYYASVIFSSVLTLVTCRMYYQGLLSRIFYPVFGVILVGELYFYLDGATRREYTVDILGENEEAYKIVNYSLMRKFLRNLFGDKLLSEKTSVNSALEYDLTTDEIIKKLEKDEDPKICAYASYLKRINAKGFQLDRSYLNSSIDLMNGKSILFNNPFYNDLIPYAFYPMNRALLEHGKVLVIVGRHSIEDNIVQWIQDGIGAVTNIPFMWNIGVLGNKSGDQDIGIVTRSSILDVDVHNANEVFLSKVKFVVIIEPSKLMTTAQIGLNILVKKCLSDEDKKLTFCICDKNCDGLVDALSHALMISLTEVSATEKHSGTLSYMTWETDSEYLHHRMVPNISRYLGMGTELSFAALKNQVSKTVWYGGEAFPVVDINWVGRQYYYDLMKYAGLPTSQDVMDERYKTSIDFWSATVSDNNYFTVEDESFNMFEILREFSTRSKEQGFVNVISSEYLLKDYMADNASVFETDAKAVPYIAADYVRTQRNTILRLMLLMSRGYISEQNVEKELSLIGIKSFDIPSQLWFEIYKCYATADELKKLPENYKEAVEAVALKSLEVSDNPKDNADVSIIKSKAHYNIACGKVETVYYIDSKPFISGCVSSLRSAEYISEDEKGELHYLGAELSEQIYQKYLPGQKFTFAGKYYEMLYLTAAGQVMVRRASDHITSRPSYRQIRKYTLTGIRPSSVIGSQKDISGMKVIREYADITVETSGYYLMDRYNDFNHARKVILGGEYSSVPVRKYCNKEILRLDLPEMNGLLGERVIYTIALMFNEVFRTLFAENQAYICAVTGAEAGTEGPLTYSLCSETGDVSSNSIYIIEDSQLDLGLTTAVERNLNRIFEIIQDYLDWHSEVLMQSLAKPEPPPPRPEKDESEGSDKKKKGIRGWFSRIAEKFKNLFKKKDKKPKKEKKKKKKKNGEPQTPDGNIAPQEEAGQESGQVFAEPQTDSPEAAGASKKKEKKKKDKHGWFGKLFGRKKRDASEQESAADDGIVVPEPVPEAETLPETETAPEAEAVPEPETVPEPEAAAEPESATEPESPLQDGAEEPSDTEDKAVQQEEDASDEDESSEEVSELPKNDMAYDSEVSEISEEKEQKETGPLFVRKPYYERYYLLYGYDSVPAETDIAGTYDYLTAMGFGNNFLKQARNGKDIAKFIEATYVPDKPNAKYCDFCGVEILGTEYEVLSDGRERCINCGRTAVKSEEHFKKLYEDVKRNFESFFGVSLNVGIRVRMVNSAKLNKKTGTSFTPTPKADGRVIGVAIKDKSGYTIMVENGAPAMASMLGIAHELTHIWQYINWNKKELKRRYGKKLLPQIYDGMAEWVEIQYAYLINEPAIAKREEIITENRKDEYGYGFLRYRANYPLTTGTVLTKPTPFFNTEMPLDPDYCGAISDLPPVPYGSAVYPDEGSSYIRTGAKTVAPPEPPQQEESAAPVQKSDSKPYSDYCRSLLDADGKEIYDRILLAVSTHLPAVDISGEASTDLIKDVISFVRSDHPELIQFGGSASVSGEGSRTVSFEYLTGADETSEKLSKLDSDAKEVLNGVKDADDFGKALFIYEYLIGNVEAAEPDTDVPDIRSAYGALVGKCAVCEGFARAAEYIMNLAGIECCYISDETHAWNLIRLDGEYYWFDAALGCAATNADSLKYGARHINYDCFAMTSDELEALGHTPDIKYHAPECASRNCNYYLRSGLYIQSADDDAVIGILESRLMAGEFAADLKCANNEIFDHFKERFKDREWLMSAAKKCGRQLAISAFCDDAKLKITVIFKEQEEGQ